MFKPEIEKMDTIDHNHKYSITVYPTYNFLFLLHVFCNGTHQSWEHF